MISNAYALWRTAGLNFSIRKVEEGVGQLRHCGWEDASAPSFRAATDVNGIVWETFTAAQQADEIRKTWPASEYAPDA